MFATEYELRFHMTLRDYNRRQYLRVGSVGVVSMLAGCVGSRIKEVTGVADDDLSWKTFEYPDDHDLDHADRSVNIINEFDESLIPSGDNRMEAIEYLEETNFRTNFVIAIRLKLPRNPHGFEITGVTEEEDQGIVVEGIRTGDGAEGNPVTLLTLVRVPNIGSAPTAVWVRYEREYRHKNERPEGELFNNPGSTSYALGSDIEDGQLVFDFPDSAHVGDPIQSVIRIENNEHVSLDYTIIVQLQELTEENDLQAFEEVKRFNTTLNHGEEWIHRHVVTPTMTGELRLAYLCYKRNVPRNPTSDNADGQTHLWIDIEE